MAFSKSFQERDTIVFLKNKSSFGLELSYLALRLARTITIYIWDLRIEKKTEIECITLADADILFFIQANY